MLNDDNKDNLIKLREAWGLADDQKWKDSVKTYKLNITEVNKVINSLSSNMASYYSNDSLEEFFNDKITSGALTQSKQAKALEILGTPHEEAKQEKTNQPKKLSNKEHTLKQASAIGKTISNAVKNIQNGAAKAYNNLPNISKKKNGQDNGR